MTESDAALLEVAEILDRLDVPFFLILGTLLGIVRDGCLIPWDRDIDLGVLIEDLSPKIPDILEASREAGWNATVRRDPLPYARAIVLRRGNQHIDLAGFLLDKGDRYSPSTLEDYCLVYPAGILEARGEVLYMGRIMGTPAPVERYLELQYGPGWRIPDKKWQPRLGPARKYGYFWRTEYGKSIDDRRLRSAARRASGLSKKGRNFGRPRRRHPRR